jgi:hypothetical protein
MIHFLKKNVYAIKFLIFCFSKYKLYRFNNLLFVIKIYIIKIFFSYQIIRKKFLYSKNIKFRETNLFFQDIEVSNIINQLDNDGISQSIVLKDKYLYQISNEINNKKNLRYQGKKFDDLNTIISYASENNISRIVIPINLDKNKTLYKFITSKFFKSVSTGYLNAQRLSINCSLFISLSKKNMSQNEKISSAQMFHFDSDFSKFLKLYIYLNNVNKINGPHVYVKQTHIKKHKKHELQKGYSDKQILKNYSTVKTLIGKKGTMFFEDSFGLHKGETPLKHYRIILNIHYGRGSIKYSKYDRYHSFK